MKSVTEMIYNVVDLAPYTWSTAGRYGLFFLAPLRVIGDELDKIASLLAM